MYSNKHREYYSPAAIVQQFRSVNIIHETAVRACLDQDRLARIIYEASKYVARWDSMATSEKRQLGLYARGKP